MNSRAGQWSWRPLELAVRVRSFGDSQIYQKCKMKSISTQKCKMKECMENPKSEKGNCILERNQKL